MGCVPCAPQLAGHSWRRPPSRKGAMASRDRRGYATHLSRIATTRRIATRRLAPVDASCRCCSWGALIRLSVHSLPRGPGHRRSPGTEERSATTMAGRRHSKAIQTDSGPIADPTTRGCHGSVPATGCHQGVSNKTVRADAGQDGKALDGPADLGRRGVGGGAIRPICRCNRDGMQGLRGSNPLSSTTATSRFPSSAMVGSLLWAAPLSDCQEPTVSKSR